MDGLSDLPAGLERLVQELDRRVATGGKLDPKAVKVLLREVEVSNSDLEVYAAFDHDPTESYGRKLVWESPLFEVMVMSWNPGDFSSIHNHGATEWGCVQVFGAARHNFFHLRDGVLELSRSETLEAGTIRKVNHSLIHQMGNAGAEPFLSLHIYGTHSPTEGITDNAANYDLVGERVIYASGGAFLQIPAHEINSETFGLKVTDQVWESQLPLLMDFFKRQESYPKTFIKVR